MLVERSIKCAGFVFAAFVFFSFSPAWAGFQWVAPPQAAPTMPAQAPQSPPPVIIDAAPTLQAAVPATKNPEVITPIIIDGTSASAQASPSAQASAPSETIDTNPSQAPVVILGKKVSGSSGQAQTLTPAPTPAAGASLAVGSGQNVVQGFADQVPLTVALRELLPPGYGFAIDQDVDMGVLVSFKGGKPWRETLAAALDPVGLIMREQAQMISIGRMPTAAVVSQAAPAPAPAPLPTNTAASAPVPLTSAVPVISPSASAGAAVKIAGTSTPPAPVIITGSAPTKAASQNAQALTLAYPNGSAAPQPVATVEMWSAERGDSLRRVLQDWSRRGHAEVEWLAEYDYPLQASINYSGTYEQAVRNLLMGFEGAHPEPVAELHVNPELGQTVLVIRARGNSSRD